VNEHLKEIAIKAGYKHPDAVGMIEDYAYFDLNRFAELIIRECADIADTCEPYRSADVILRHFGVDNGNL
jgi:hypothetical protein